jgi:PAS domain S-box-containing protein
MPSTQIDANGIPAAMKILVVDDDSSARLLMRAALRKSGFDVTLAEGGEDALRQFDAAHHDLVMLDVDMPDMSGHAVCAALRAKVGDSLPIVMVTGMDDVLSVERAYESGATDFIAKPIHWALIGHRVKYLLRGHQNLIDLRAADARNAALLGAIPDLLFELDIDGRYIDYHAPYADLLAVPAENPLGRNVADVLPPPAAQVCMAALHAAQEFGSSIGMQYELQLNNLTRWYELSVSRKTMAAGEKPRFIALSRDITERKEAEGRIARMAYFDSLTGLPNRLSFLERVDREIRSAELKSAQLAVLFMDLDGFKGVNDTLGHGAGDLILQWSAERLREGLRPADMVARPMLPLGAHADVELARLGGDEFTALILNVVHPEDALLVAHRIGELMRRPFMLEGRLVTLTTSIGIALYPDNGRDAATLLKHADTAMYHAKTLGRDNAQFYSASLTRQAVLRMELDASLRAALERDEFFLLYQPQLDVVTGRTESVEALIRWRHPQRGIVSPVEFIGLAEENGLIERIGLWVLNTACADAANWNRTGTPMRVAVNLSPVQFKATGLVQSITDVLMHTGLAPGLLELEVTESALAENSSATINTLRALRDHGVRIALDDFGTGYSSLGYLTRMPISHIKIDRTFVHNLVDGTESVAIIRAVLAMAGSLGLSVTAEGVETADQAQALVAMGCDSLQGFYFSRPVAVDAIDALRLQHWNMDASERSAIESAWSV